MSPNFTCPPPNANEGPLVPPLPYLVVVIITTINIIIITINLRRSGMGNLTTIGPASPINEDTIFPLSMTQFTTSLNWGSWQHQPVCYWKWWHSWQLGNLTSCWGTWQHQPVCIPQLPHALLPRVAVFSIPTVPGIIIVSDNLYDSDSLWYYHCLITL